MEVQPPSTPAPRLVIPAATLIVFRDAIGPDGPELLMLERAAHMRFAAGASVFPGGRVDPPDRALARDLAPHLGPDDGAARIAAIRETLEETGLLLGVSPAVTADVAAAARALVVESGALRPVLDRYALTLEPDRLVPFAHWCPRWERAFDTRFYLADIGTGDVSTRADGSETVQLDWSSAANTLRKVAQNQVSVLFPTLCNLERLAALGSFAEACAEARAVPPRRIEPWTEQTDGTRWHCIPEGLGYPVTRHLAEQPADSTRA